MINDNTQARNWVGTLNFVQKFEVELEFLEHQFNWQEFDDERQEIEDDLRKVINKINPIYYIFGYEVGDNNNPHVQFYMEFGRGIRRGTIKNYFEEFDLPTPHLEQRRGSAKQASDYCKKSNLYIESEDKYGDDDIEDDDQPKKRPRQKAVEIIKEYGYAYLVKNDLELAHSVNSRTCQLYDDLKYGQKRKNDPPVNFNWYFGDPGSGKTYMAEEWLGINDEEYAAKFSGEQFFPLYHAGIRNILLDNVVLQSKKELQDILGFGERNQYFAEIKGGTYHVHCYKLACTSVQSPRELFENMDPKLQKGHTYGEIERRITALWYVKERDSIMVPKDTYRIASDLDFNNPNNEDLY
jgi:hypothetical protein